MSTPFDTPVAHFTRNRKNNKLPFLNLEAKNITKKVRSFSERLADSDTQNPAVNQLENCKFSESLDQLSQEFIDDIFSQTNSFTEQRTNLSSKMPLTYADLVSRIDRKIPEYKGTEDASTTNFVIDKIKEIRDLCAGDPLAGVALNEIKDKFRGEAYDTLSTRTVETFDNLIELLKENLPSYSVESVHTKFKFAKQEDGEATSAYAHRVEKLAHDYKQSFLAKYGQNLPESFISEEIKHTFVYGLRNTHTQAAVIPQLPIATLKNLITIGETIEQAQEARTQNTIVCQFCKIKGHTADKCRKISNGSPNQNSGGPRPQNSPPRSDPRALQNNQKSPQPQNGTRPFQQQNSRPYYPQNFNSQPKICEYCSNIGHTIADCRKRMRAMSFADNPQVNNRPPMQNSNPPGNYQNRPPQVQNPAPPGNFQNKDPRLQTNFGNQYRNNLDNRARYNPQGPRSNQDQNYQRQNPNSPNMNGMMEQMGNMQINHVAIAQVHQPADLEAILPHPENRNYPEQGNDIGSDH